MSFEPDTPSRTPSDSPVWLGLVNPDDTASSELVGLHGVSIAYAGVTTNGDVVTIDLGHGQDTTVSVSTEFHDNEYVAPSFVNSPISDSCLDAFLEWYDNDFDPDLNQELAFNTPAHLYGVGIESVQDQVLDNFGFGTPYPMGYVPNDQDLVTPSPMKPKALDFGNTDSTEHHHMQISGNNDPLGNVSPAPKDGDDNFRSYLSDNEFDKIGSELDLLAYEVTCGNTDCCTQCICSRVPISQITPNYASVCACDDCCDGKYCDKLFGRDNTRFQLGVEQACAIIDKDFPEINQLKELLNKNSESILGRKRKSRGHPKGSTKSTSFPKSKRSKTDYESLSASMVSVSNTNINSQEVTVTLSDDVVPLTNSVDKRPYMMSEATRAEKLEKVYNKYRDFTGKHVGSCWCPKCRH